MPAHIISSEQQRDRMLHTPIPKLIVSLSIPTLASQLISVFYNTADTYFVSKLSTSASAAVGVVFSLMSIIQAFGFGIGMGCGSIISRSLGNRDNERADRTASSAFFFAAAVGLLICIAGLCTLRPLMRLLGSTETILPYSESYARIILLAAPVMCASFVLNNTLRSEGEAMLSMYGICAGGLLNVALDPLFIFVLGLGVRGAALATVISQAVSAVWVMTFLTGKKTRWHLKRENLHVDAKIVLPCIALGLSPFVMQSTESLIAICFNSSLLRYGGDMAVGTMTVLTSIMQFSNMPLQGLTQGAQPIVSYNFGAKNAQRVRDAYFCLLRACFTYSMAIWLLVELFPRAFILIFNNDPALVEYAAWAVRIYMGCSGIFGIQIACQQTFVALGNAKTSLFLAVWRKIILLIPLIYILPHFFADKAFAVFLAEPVADFGAVALTSFTFYRQFRRSMRELEGAEATGER